MPSCGGMLRKTARQSRIPRSPRQGRPPAPPAVKDSLPSRSWRARSILILLLLCSCGRQSIPAPSRETPVILISIDTLRSDHLPAYGYEGVATPNIDALRADSILYRRAYSHVPLTLPSHATILTGMLPADHGIRDNVGFRLGDSTPTIQEHLKQNGYATGAVVSSFVLRHQTGVLRGFDFVDDQVKPMNGETVIGRVQRDGRETLEAGRKWLDARIAQKGPFFFFLHLYDPHTPYKAPEPYFSRYSNRYDGEIAYVDSIVGELVADLKQSGVYDKALIILLSDHGEGLNDHGEEEHGLFLYREDLQVPLILKLPKERRAGATVDTPVELADVFPTILERTGISPPKSGRRIGQSLLSFLDGPGAERAIYSESYYSRFHFGWSDLHSLIEGDSHYIRAPSPELYDLKADPAETKNLVSDQRRVYARLRQAIEPFVKEAAAPANIDPEEASKLAALGYIGSAVPTKSGESLPDPKTKLQVFHDIRQAYTWYRSGDTDAALRLTDGMLADNGQITDLWDLKSKILFKMKRHADAMEAAKEGLRHVPGSITLLFDVANVALFLGDLDTAQKHAEIAVKIEPGEAHEILGKIWYRRGDDKRAEEEATLGVKTHYDPSSSLLLLGRIHAGRGDFAGALRYLDEAAERVKQRDNPRLQELYSTRGDVLARLGRNEEAERDFRAEMRDFPIDPRAYSSLILLLASERRTTEATQVVFEAIKTSPRPNTYAAISETLIAIGDDRGAAFWLSQGLQRFPADAELRALSRGLKGAGGLARGAATH